MALIVVGSANMDMVVHAPRFPSPGETLIGSSFATFPGGKGANQAVAAGRLGGDVRFVGQVGHDPFGESLRASLNQAGVDTVGLVTHESLPTGIAAITVDDSGQNTIVVAPGANGAVTAKQALGFIGSNDSVLVQLEIPVKEVYELLECAPGHKILNPAPANHLPDSVLAKLDVITPNETEAEMITGIRLTDDSSALAACRWFLDRGVRQVVITLGEQGAYCHGIRLCGKVEPWAVHTIDTVGAGDAFSGALACFLDCGEDFSRSIRLASIAAGLSTTRVGAQASMPTRAEVMAVAANCRI